MLLLKSLQLNNFLSHEKIEINFTEKQSLLIDGESGSGKSSIIESIIWALYGQGRASNTALIHKGARKAIVTLTLESEGHSYVIERSISGTKHMLTVKIDGVASPLTGIRELQAWIEKELIGASYTLFVNSIAYVQGGTDTFVTQTAAGRKDILLEIVKTDDFDMYYEKARGRLQQIETDLIVTEHDIANTSLTILSLQNMVNKKDSLESSLIETTESEQGLRKQWTSLLEQEAAFISKENKIKSHEAIRDELIKTAQRQQEELDYAEQDKQTLKESYSQDNDLLVLNDKIALLQATIDARNATLIKNEEKSTLLSEKLALKPVVNSYMELLNALNTQLHDITTLDTCPSGEKCPHQKDRPLLISQLQSQIAQTSQKMIDEEKAMSLWQEEFDALPQLDFVVTYSTAQNYDQKLNRLYQDRNAIESRISLRKFLQQNIEKIPKLKNAIASTNKNIDEMNLLIHKLEETNDVATQIAIRHDKEDTHQKMIAQQNLKAQLISQIADIHTAEDQLKKLIHTNNMLASSVKMDQENKRKLLLIKDAFGSKGIKTVVIDWLLPALEDRINEVLSTLSDFRIRLDTQRERADGEGNIEGLFITIFNELNEELDYDLYSGGEKVRIMMAITEGLASIAKKVGFRLMDEAIYALSADMTADFSDVIIKLQEKYPQVLAISHLEEIKALFEDQLLIKKTNGVSAVHI